MSSSTGTVVTRGGNGIALHNESVFFEHTPYSFSVIIDVRMQHNEGGYKFNGEGAMIERSLHAMTAAAKEELVKRNLVCYLNATKKIEEGDEDDQH